MFILRTDIANNDEFSRYFSRRSYLCGYCSDDINLMTARKRLFIELKTGTTFIYEYLISSIIADGGGREGMSAEAIECGEDLGGTNL